MANYTSQPQRFNKPTSSINLAYIDSVIKQKSAQIDENYGIMSQTVDKVLGQDLIREQDREYLKTKLADVITTLQNTDSIKFSSRRSKFAIQDGLAQAARDPEVLKRIAETKSIRDAYAFGEKKMKEGKLNQDNYNYALKKMGIDDYMKGADSLGKFNYTEYRDVDKKMADSVKFLKTMAPNEAVSIVDEEGKTISKKVSMLTPEEIRDYVTMQLDSEDRRQLMIDGAYRYKMDDAYAVEIRDKRLEEGKREYDNKIKEYQNQIDNGNLDPRNKQLYQSRIAKLETQKSEFEKSISLGTTAEEIGAAEILENRLNYYANTFSKDGPASIKYSDTALKKLRDTNTNAALIANRDLITTRTVDTDIAKKLDKWGTLESNREQALQRESSNLAMYFGKLGEGKQAIVKKTEQELLPQLQRQLGTQNISNETLQKAVVDKLGTQFFGEDLAAKIKNSIRESDRIYKADKQLTTGYIKQKLSNKDVFLEFYYDETELGMFTPNGEVNVRDFLKKNQVRDLESYQNFVNSDTKEAKMFRAHVSLQAMSLTSDIGDRLEDIGTLIANPFSMAGDILNSSSLIEAGANLGAGLNTQSKAASDTFELANTRKFTVDKAEFKILQQASEDLTEKSLDSTYNITNNGDNITLELKDSNTDFARIIASTNDAYQRGRTVGVGAFVNSPLQTLGITDSDKTIRNESVIGEKFGEDDFTNYALENMSYYEGTVAADNTIEINPNDTEEFKQIFSEISSYASHDDFDPERRTTITPQSDGSLLIYQTIRSQGTTVDTIGEDNPEVENETRYVQARIEKNDIPKLRYLNSMVEFNKRDEDLKSITDLNEEPVSNFSYTPNNSERVNALATLYNINDPREDTLARLAVAEDAEKMLFSPQNIRYLDNTRGYEIYDQFVKFKQNTNDYSVQLMNSPRGYDVIVRDTKSKEEVGKVPISEDIDYNTFIKAYDATPQVFLSLLIQRQIQELIDSQIATNARR